MAEGDRRPKGRPAAGADDPPAGFDRELDLRGIWGFAALVAATTVLLHLAVWGILVGYRKAAVRRDPAPSPLAEANERRLPPSPRLQDAPARDLESLRAEEDARLSTYGWIDHASGVGHIPIERAIDLILERGLPEVGAPTAGPGTEPAAEPGKASSPPRRDRRATRSS